jgi:hypothetical protein
MPTMDTGMGNGMVPLGQLASVKIAKGMPGIRTENALLAAYIYVDTRKGDLSGFVARARRAVAEKVKFPPGYYITWSGQFENMERAIGRMTNTSCIRKVVGQQRHKKRIETPYHWSLRQVEYSTDLMFRSERIVVPLYDALSRQAVLAANAERVSGFLGKKVTPQRAKEIGSRLSARIEGRCIKHTLGAAGVKVYDKFSRVLRVETTVNDVSFFKHHRKVEHKDGHATREWASLKKTITSLNTVQIVNIRIID